MKPNFRYQYEKLADARSSLMAPHPLGEDADFKSAFDSCSLALDDFDVRSVKDPDALRWIGIIQKAINTKGLTDPTGEGTHMHRARTMTQDEKSEFSKAVNELASWFDHQF